VCKEKKFLVRCEKVMPFLKVSLYFYKYISMQYKLYICIVKKVGRKEGIRNGRERERGRESINRSIYVSDWTYFIYAVIR